jgi:hypothetical protein
MAYVRRTLSMCVYICTRLNQSRTDRSLSFYIHSNRTVRFISKVKYSGVGFQCLPRADNVSATIHYVEINKCDAVLVTRKRNAS